MLAGFLALGMTFKPQNMLLTLVFLLFWAISDRRRWRFALGFSLACFGAWLFAEWLEPHWVSSFLHGVQAYSGYLHPKGILDQFWGGGAALLKIALISIAFWLFYRTRHASPDSLPFVGEVPGRPGLFLALGHGHFGMTGGPPSGRLVARIVNRQSPGLDLAPYAVTRFQ